MSPTLDPQRYRAVPFQKAIAYLQQKVVLPSRSWRDYRDALNDAIFTVAGAKLDLVRAIRDLMLRALQEGWTLKQWRRQFLQTAAGWSGSNDWRARVIYQTNMRMAYAAGRYAHQLDPQVLKVQPYLQFVHSDAAVPRPLHKALDGKVFLATEIPFAVPNGFGCGCRYVSLSEAEVRERGLPIETLRRGDWLNTEAGPMQVLPEAGFDYIPGQASPQQRRQMLEEKMQTLPPRLAQIVRNHLQQQLEKYADEQSRPATANGD